MIENHFIAPKARQELYETGSCGFSIKNRKTGSAIGDAFLIEMKYFCPEAVLDVTGTRGEARWGRRRMRRPRLR